MVTIKIIVGTVRPGRFGIKPAEWLLNLARQRSDAQYELVDLQTVNLPMLDEAAPPMMGTYTQEHTKKWSELINAADGFVFIVPEYNYSFSPVLKNAIDFLWHEWNDKPVSYLGYGVVGGARAIEQLRSVAAATKMFDLREDVRLENFRQLLDADGNFQPTEHHLKAANTMLDQLVFWAEQMQRARAAIDAKDKK
ncbi:MAG TPA: NAD(P)H-dependent oxidoreductase [Candidatus Acidoferrum sp.]|nr:NAD(P)H-dependent oxidoreductase [Candidatus Acidoferrum sp.]